MAPGRTLEGGAESGWSLAGSVGIGGAVGR
jgi:hypothetical protein